MMDRFGTKYSKREFLREFQKPEESCVDFFRRIKSLGRKVTIDPEWSFEIAYKGIRSNIEKFQLALIGTSEIDDKCLNIISQTEKIIVESEKRRFNFNNRNKRKSVNYVSEVEETIKENSIYFNNFRFFLVVDTGSSYNFITQRIKNRLKAKTVRLIIPLKLYTCLLTPFYIEEKIKLKFKVKDEFYEDSFYIMPERNDESVILGNVWLRENAQIVEPAVTFKSCKEALESLCKENQDGVKNYFCEIKNKGDEKVVDVPYKIPQALESKIDDEIKRLLEKKYIRESNSSWLNNIRPVQKDDGSIRLTTNLIKLNRLVELDRYSVASMEELIFRLCGNRYFSKIDVKEGFSKFI